MWSMYYHWYRDWEVQLSMYEVGAFFLSHKMAVKRMKNKGRRGR